MNYINYMPIIQMFFSKLASHNAFKPTFVLDMGPKTKKPDFLVFYPPLLCRKKTSHWIRRMFYMLYATYYTALAVFIQCFFVSYTPSLRQNPYHAVFPHVVRFCQLKFAIVQYPPGSCESVFRHLLHGRSAGPNHSATHPVLF